MQNEPLPPASGIFGQIRTIRDSC